MGFVFSHFRSKFLAGIIAAIPIIVTIAIVYTLEQYTQSITKWLGLSIPGLGTAIAAISIYLLGVMITSLIGVYLLQIFDHMFSSLPGIKVLYQAWKDILLVPPNRSGMYHQVVMVQTGTVPVWEIGFTSNLALKGRDDMIPVLVPNVPNPLTARLLLVRRESCQFPKVTVDEAFKFFFFNRKLHPTGTDYVDTCKSGLTD